MKRAYIFKKTNHHAQNHTGFMYTLERMVKALLFSFTIISFAACKNSGNDNAVITTDNFNIYRYKVLGLNDSITSDSIWKMIFSVDGIEEMVINKDDSTVSVKVIPDKITTDKISAEIELRGATVIQTIE